jgi:RNA polymerase sigma-70 factor (ECF subfamily)
MDKKREFRYIVNFQKHYRNIYKTVLYILKDENTAYDIAQETFIKGYKYLHTLSDMNKFKPWILKVATNLAYDYLKSRKEVFTVEDMDKLIAIEEEVRKKMKQNDVETSYINKEVTKAVREAIKSLDKKYSLILVYRFYCDMTYEEIAKKLKLNINTVKTRLRRGKKKLKQSKQLRKYIEGEGS